MDTPFILAKQSLKSIVEKEMQGQDTFIEMCLGHHHSKLKKQRSYVSKTP
jgi:hypothetical protein